MLLEFSVENYRGFEKEIKFNLSKVGNYDFNNEAVNENAIATGVIYGENASGKSNLMKGIQDIRTLLREGIIDEKYGTFINGDSGKEEAIFKYRLKINNEEIKIEYKKTKERALVYEKLEINERVIYEYDFKENKLLENGLETVGAKSLNMDNLENINSVLGYVFTNTPYTQLGNTYVELITWIRGIHVLKNTTDKKYFRDMEKLIIENNGVEGFNKLLSESGVKESIETVKETSGEKRIYRIYKKKSLLFEDVASSGTKDLLGFYALYLLEGKGIGSLLLLDELDAFFHFELTESLIKKLKERAVQTIISTHNTNILTNRLLRPDCFFIIGNNYIDSLPNLTDKELREGNNLEKIYLGNGFQR